MEPLLLRLRIGLLPAAGVFQWSSNMSGERKESAQLNRPVTDEAVFKAAKEIVVKFIEVGRLTPTNFEETYARVFEAVRKSVRSE
jgi:hypothetical protein